MMIVRNAEMILTQLDNLTSGSGHLIRNDKASMPYAIQIMADGKRIILCSPEINEVEMALAKLHEDGLVYLRGDTISLTDAGRAYARQRHGTDNSATGIP